MTKTPRNLVFDYQLLRLLVGIIAFTLPCGVKLTAGEGLPSISSSYHTDARDYFTGMLCIIGAFLLAYQGHSGWQAVMSKLASVATFLVVWCPTSKGSCNGGTACTIHYIAAAVLFGILTWFCLGPFLSGAGGKTGKEAKRRFVAYFFCGVLMAGSLLTAFFLKLVLSDDTMDAWRVTYRAEAMSLYAFGFAWLVAGRILPFFSTKKERSQLVQSLCATQQKPPAS